MISSSQQTSNGLGLQRVAARLDPVGVTMLAVLALLALSGWEVLVWDPRDEIPRSPEGVEGWFFATGGASPLPVLLLVGWLAWRRRHRLAAEAARPGPSWAAAPLVAASLATAAWSHYTGAPDLQIPALSLALLGAGVSLAGLGALRALGWPALVALLAIPLPVTLANGLLYPLQRLAGYGASVSLGLLGIAHDFLGDQLYVDDRLFYVIETCSGLRSVLTLLLGAVLYCEIFFRGRSQVLFLVLVAPLLGLVVNQLRVVTIILNPLSEFSTIHTLQGMASLFGGMFLLAGLDRVHALVRRGGSAPAPGPGPRPVRRFRPRRVAFALAAAAALWPLGAVVPEWSAPPTPRPPLSRLPTQLGEWRVEKGLAPDYTFLGSARFSEWVKRRYAHPERAASVDVFVAADDHRQRFHDLLSPKLALPGAGWQIADRARVRVGDGGPEAERLWLERNGGRVLSLSWTSGAASFPEEVLRAALVLDRGPLHREQRIVAVRITTAANASPRGRATARQRVREVATLVAAELATLGVMPAPEGAPGPGRAE